MLNREAMSVIRGSETAAPFVKSLETLYDMIEQTDAAHGEMALGFVEDDAVSAGDFVPEIVLRIRRIYKD